MDFLKGSALIALIVGYQKRLHGKITNVSRDSNPSDVQQTVYNCEGTIYNLENGQYLPGGRSLWLAIEVSREIFPKIPQSDNHQIQISNNQWNTIIHEGGNGKTINLYALNQDGSNDFRRYNENYNQPNNKNLSASTYVKFLLDKYTLQEANIPRSSD